MIYINILTAFPNPLFMHQLDKERFGDKIYFTENSDEDIVWDYIVVYENLKPNLCKIRYRKGGLIFISGEPENSNPYCHRFLNQFDYIISSHKCFKSPKNHLTQQALNWHFGYSHREMRAKYDYLNLKNMPLPQKQSDMSMICSSKTMMPGHVERYNFYQVLSKRFKGRIDFFGYGIKPVDDKAEAILPYRFHICIENSATDDYWTEKIADAILGYAVPVYFGCTNITRYFPEEAIVWIDITNTNVACDKISELLSKSETIYQNKLPYLNQARSLLLNQYNIFPMLESFIASVDKPSEEVVVLLCKPWNDFLTWKIRYYMLRLRRLFFKVLHKMR